MKELKQKILDFAAKDGIDLVGFADRSRFAQIPAEKNPFSIFPRQRP